jgi:hypothetical protein
MAGLIGITPAITNVVSTQYLSIRLVSEDADKRNEGFLGRRVFLHIGTVRRVNSSPLRTNSPSTKTLPVLRLAEQHAGKPRFLELPDKSSTCSVARLAQMAARSALAHGGQRLMRNAADETADFQHCKGLFDDQGHETLRNTRQTTVAFDILDGAYHALYRRDKPTLTR